MNFGNCFVLGGSDDWCDCREQETVHNFIDCGGHGALNGNY